MFTFIQIWHGEITEQVIKSEIAIRAVMLPVDRYVRIETSSTDRPREYSCWNRIALAAAIPTMLYVDIDKTMLQRPSIDEHDKPHFAKHENGTQEGCISVFAVNGRCDIFSKMLEMAPSFQELRTNTYCKMLNSGMIDFCLFRPYIYK
jgi:hypothetical protein